MARLYQKSKINEVLKELEIKPVDNRVTSQEAASILTWRAKREHGIDYQYSDASVRRHVSLGNFKDVKQVSIRHSLYNVEEVFELPIKPRHKPKQNKVLTK